MFGFFSALIFFGANMTFAGPAVRDAKTLYFSPEVSITAFKHPQKSETPGENWNFLLSNPSGHKVIRPTQLCAKKMDFDGEVLPLSPSTVKMDKKAGTVWLWKVDVTSNETGYGEVSTALVYLRGKKLRCLHRHNADGADEIALFKNLAGK